MLNTRTLVVLHHVQVHVKKVCVTLTILKRRSKQEKHWGVVVGCHSLEVWPVWGQTLANRSEKTFDGVPGQSRWHLCKCSLPVTAGSVQSPHCFPSSYTIPSGPPWPSYQCGPRFSWQEARVLQPLLWASVSVWGPQCSWHVQEHGSAEVGPSPGLCPPSCPPHLVSAPHPPIHWLLVHNKIEEFRNYIQNSCWIFGLP